MLIVLLLEWRSNYRTCRWNRSLWFPRAIDLLPASGWSKIHFQPLCHPKRNRRVRASKVQSCSNPITYNPFNYNSNTHNLHRSFFYAPRARLQPQQLPSSISAIYRSSLFLLRHLHTLFPGLHRYRSTSILRFSMLCQRLQIVKCLLLRSSSNYIRLLHTYDLFRSQHNTNGCL